MAMDHPLCSDRSQMILKYVIGRVMNSFRSEKMDLAATIALDKIERFQGKLETTK